jgi:hypothetical protein
MMILPGPPQTRAGEASHSLISWLQTKRVRVNDLEAERGNLVERAEWEGLHGALAPTAARESAACSDCIASRFR